MKVVVSGGTSYTGCCIAEAFARRGHDATALCRAPLETYSGLRRLRLERMRNAGVRIEGGIVVETGAMAEWIGANRLDVWIHHHHPMEDFRSPDYDVERGRSVAIDPLDRLVTALREAGASAFLLSGTYFEPGEGGRLPSASSTPYAKLKGELSQAIAVRAADAGFAFGKVVIAAPTGALENDDRLTPQLIHAAARHSPYQLRSPDSVMDMISGEALADAYVEMALERLESHNSGFKVSRPSGWIVSAGEWAKTVQATILRELGTERDLELDIPDESNRPPPVAFQNPSSERVEIDWECCLKRYALEWSQNQPFL